MVEQRRFSRRALSFAVGIPSSFISNDGRTPPSNPILKISGADGILPPVNLPAGGIPPLCNLQGGRTQISKYGGAEEI